MRVRPAGSGYALVLVLLAGCGRIGVAYLTPDELTPEQTAGEPDAAEPDPSDASDVEPSDALTENDADIVEAGEEDAGDGGMPTAAVPDCQLMVGGSMVGYRTGEIATLSGLHMLTLDQTGLCASSAGCTWDLGSEVAQAACDVSTCQMWESAQDVGGWFLLRNAMNGACLYLADTTDGTNAITWECFGSDRIRWQLACAGDDTWHLISKLSSKWLGGDGTSAPGAGVVQAASASAGQRWRISSNANAYEVVMTSGESDANAVWRYTTSAPPGTWREPSFNDSAWSSGPGGFGDTSRALTMNRTSWTTSDIWLRRTFSLSSIPARLSVQVFHDEVAEVYINGAAVSIPNGWSHGYQSVNVPDSVRSALTVGTNTVAVHCRNTTAPQFIDVGLVSYTWQ